MDELIILDVAHGNTALLISNNMTTVFDVAPKDILFQVLNKYNIDIIDYLFVSHSDKDHLGGLINILSSNKIIVKNIFLNPDSTKKGSSIRKLRIIVNDTISRNNTQYSFVHSSMPQLSIGDTLLQILSPSVDDLLSGPGGVDSSGASIDSNSSSTVLRVKHDGHPVALFTADIDDRALNKLIKKHSGDLKADLLVFPHHGGMCSDDNGLFAEKILDVVRPKFTVFSLGRESFLNPRLEIISAIKKVTPDSCIMCTQLSKNCLKNLPDDKEHWGDHLNDLPSAGRVKSAFCAGSLRITLKGNQTVYPDSENHRAFIKSNIPNAMCIFT